MKHNDVLAFTLVAAGMRALYNITLSEELLDVYWQALKSFDLEDLKRALKRSLTNPNVGQGCPKPADAVRFVEGSSESETEVLQAWSTVERAVRTVGMYQSFVVDALLVDEVLKAIDRWITLCGTTLTDPTAPSALNEAESLMIHEPAIHSTLCTGMTGYDRACPGGKGIGKGKGKGKGRGKGTGKEGKGNGENKNTIVASEMRPCVGVTPLSSICQTGISLGADAKAAFVLEANTALRVLPAASGMRSCKATGVNIALLASHTGRLSRIYAAARVPIDLGVSAVSEGEEGMAWHVARMLAGYSDTRQQRGLNDSPSLASQDNAKNESKCRHFSALSKEKTARRSCP